MKFIIIGITITLILRAHIDATPTFPRVQRQLEQLQQQIINTPATTLESHISDYRGNKRSDSRADKPEQLNNSTENPADVEPVSIKLTPSSTLNIRRDTYANFIGNAIQNFRKGFRSAVDHVQSRLQRPRIESQAIMNARLTTNTTNNATKNDQTTELNDFNVNDVSSDSPDTDFNDGEDTTQNDGDEENTENLQIIQIISNIFKFLRSPHNGGGPNGRNETEFKYNVRKLKTLLLERKIKTITEFIINPLIISMNNLTGVLNGNGTPSTTEMVDGVNEKLTSDEHTNDNDIDEYMTSSGSSLLNREQARNLDNYGIMIMEVFGSVIGLTWGFISQIKGFLMRS